MYEHDTWIFALTRVADNEPPDSLTGMIRMATHSPRPHCCGYSSGESRSVKSRCSATRAHWRRYDKMDRFPSGLLVFGDAICSSNPIYGQGMTVAALEATALQACLAEADGDIAQRFFAAAAEQIGPMWASNQFNDHGQWRGGAGGVQGVAGLPRGGAVRG